LYRTTALSTSNLRFIPVNLFQDGTANMNSNLSTSTRSSLITAIICLTGFSAHAWADNIAAYGTGIIGLNDAVDGDAGTGYFQAGALNNIKDGDTSSRVDTWAGNLHNDKPVSYVGILWPAKRYEEVASLTLTLATFFDGGWFAPSLARRACARRRGHAHASPFGRANSANLNRRRHNLDDSATHV
ncbi:MAG: hypothetical protein QHJ82_14565, partial [Verrucomicrobiota bacterium]|nr:hypothetical protein [Verrucomicrobiota bacterium]